MNYAEEKRIRPVSGFAGLAVFIAILLVAISSVVFLSSSYRRFTYIELISELPE